MKKGPTLLLKLTILGLGLLVLGVCVFALPIGIFGGGAENYGAQSSGADYSLILAGLYIPAIPFFYALFKAMKILDLIDKNQAFSEASAEALKHIKYCAFIISSMFALAMPYVFQVADKDDAPGVVLLGLVVTVASLVIASFATVLQKLVQHAATIKDENDLTV